MGAAVMTALLVFLAGAAWGATAAWLWLMWARRCERLASGVLDLRPLIQRRREEAMHRRIRRARLN